jgi:pimeloyl-ACP methyl ester carboxylesterase
MVQEFSNLKCQRILIENYRMTEATFHIVCRFNARLVHILLGLGCLLCGPAMAAERQEVTLHVRSEVGHVRAIHRKPAEPNGHSPVLFLHSYEAPCADAFDLPGYSWLDELSREGFDAWAIDLHGFGKYGSLASMQSSAKLSTAVADVSQVIDDLKQRSSTQRVTLVGWGWGGVLAAMASIEDPASVDRLVLLGVMDGKNTAVPLDAWKRAVDGAPEMVGAEALMSEWTRMLSGIEEDATPDAFEQFRHLIQRCSPSNPMGPVKDMVDIWSTQLPFEPHQISVPTLLLRGDHDDYVTGGLASQISGSHELVLHHATHWVPYEKGRTFLYLHVSNFLAHKNLVKP